MQQIIFILLLLAVAYFSFRLYGQIIYNIKLGQPEALEGNRGERWKNVLLVAFGQKKMFKRIIPAIFHLFIYVAFLFTQIELIEIIIDGISGKHRFFADKLGFIYPLIINTIEVLSLLALIATVIFLLRRNLLKVPRLTWDELNGWPKLDANLILIGEIILVAGIFSMNSADLALQNMGVEGFPETGTLFLSGLLADNLLSGMSQSTLYIIERVGWWMHILAVLAFILYLPLSKHLHIIFSFPNVYYAKLKPRGEMKNMPAIMNEVKGMMGIVEDEMPVEDELPEFGARDIFGMSWKRILDAYSCTECGRCTAVCPAHITGKKLSPRKIVMNIRDRATEVGGKIKHEKLDPANYDDGKSLFDYISDEEIFACTTCNACVEACPILIDPLAPILELRRYRILTDSAGPTEWMPMFNSIESSGAVWQMPSERFDWASEGTTD